ncbi:hypothetical protein LCGC14_1936320, partial [marine sediment metagenome]
RKLDLSHKVFDTALLKISANRYIWYLNMHHLVTDGVSRKIVFKRMAGLYADLLTNPMTGPTVKSSSYLDYVSSELKRNAIQHEKKQTGIAVSNTSELPSFYGVKRSTRVTKATRVPISLGAERSDKLKRLLKHPDIRGFTEQQTLFTTLSGLLFIYMYRVSGQKDLALGALLHNRVSRRFHDTVGYFLEIYPLTSEIGEKDTFRTLLQRVKFENNQSLKNALQDSSDKETNSAFNVVLNFIHNSFPDFNGYKTTSEWIYTGHIDSNHHLRCHVLDYDSNAEIRLSFDLNNGVFSDELIQKVPHHFLKLMDAMLADMDSPIEKPSLLTSEERQLFLKEDNASNESLNSIVARFENNAKEHPNAVALQHNDKTYTYAGLNKKANQLAHYLQRKGIGKEDKVALYFKRSSEYVISVLAVLKTGAAFIPIASDQASDRIAYMLTDAECSLLLKESGLGQKLDLDGVETLTLSEEKNTLLTEETSNLGLDENPEDLAYILYTSGSTGRPKGVLITHASISNYLDWAVNRYQIDQWSVFPLFTSIGFDLTLTSTFLPLIKGGRIIVYEENQTGPDLALLQVVEDNLVNVIKLTPSHLALLQGRNLSASHVKTMIVGGEDFKVPLAKSITSHFSNDLKIFNEYGPTEATVGCIVSEFNVHEHTGASVPIGKPIVNMQAYVLDNHLNLVPKGVIGELYLSGTGLAKGYSNAGEMTSSKFVDNPFSKNSKMYRTGDLVRINANDDFEYLGRIDEQVKLRGHRIELSDIEANLATHPDIENCAVVLVEDKKSIPENEV